MKNESWIILLVLCTALGIGGTYHFTRPNPEFAKAVKEARENGRLAGLHGVSYTSPFLGSTRELHENWQLGLIEGAAERYKGR